MKHSPEELEVFYHDLIDELLKLDSPNATKINSTKIDLAKKHKFNAIVKNPQILGYARGDTEREKLIQLFNTKPIREASGVTVVALFAKPHSCPHGKCMYCPGGPGSPFGDTPQSYTGQEPAAMRAKRNLYDPYLQIFNRLEHYVANGHDPDKLELIFMGGTFPSLDQEYRDSFVKYVYKAINDFGELFFEINSVGKRIIRYDTFNEFFEMSHDFSSNERMLRVHEKMYEQKEKNDDLSMNDQITKNETAIIRAIGLTVETKPDWALQSHCADMLRYGCTRLEIGVQTLDESCLKKTNRGHTLEDTKKCFQVAKDMCFKINAHMMLGLPASTLEIDEEGLIGLFDLEDYRPDMLKIYPCLVVKGTPLYNMYKMGKFEPIDTELAAKIIARSYGKFPRYVRVMRVQRDIPTTLVEEGVQKSNLRQYVEDEMKRLGVESKDIRAREIGLRQLQEKDRKKKEVKLNYDEDEVIAVNISIPIKGELAKICQELYDQDTSEYSNDKQQFIPHISLSMKALKKSQLQILISKLEHFQFESFEIKAKDLKNEFLTVVDVEKNEKLNELQGKILELVSEFEDHELSKDSFSISSDSFFEDNIKWVENFSVFDSAHISVGKSIENFEGIDVKELSFELDTILVSQMGNFCSVRKKLVEIDVTKNIDKNTFDINVEEFNASLGKEFFIDVVNKEDTMIGFIRLRLPHEAGLMPEIDEKTALIRELHIYGQTIPVGAESFASQHKGWGTKLVQKCEEIAKENGYEKIAIISGVGVREYYKKLGYEKEGPYMIKRLNV